MLFAKAEVAYEDIRIDAKQWLSLKAGENFYTIM